MTWHLMNAANMPQPGNYYLEEIDEETFIDSIHIANDAGRLKSYIGYPANIDFLERLTGIRFNLSREETVLQPGDVLIIMKLPYRPDIGIKKAGTAEMQFKYYIAEYTT